MINQVDRRAGMVHLPLGLLLLPPCAVTAVLWLSSPYPLEMTAGFYAFCLLLMPWGAYLSWRQGSRQSLPVFGLVASAYWVFFGLALFLGQRTVFLAGDARFFTVSEAGVTRTMLMAVVGVLALWFGTRIPLSAP